MTWWFNLIKKVRSSIVPEKKKGIPKLSKAHKAKVTVTSLTEQCISKASRFWPITHHPSPTRSPLQSRLGFMSLLVVFPHQRKVGWAEIFPHSLRDFAKAVNSELHALSPSDYQNAFESWRRRLELCVRSGGECFEGM